MSFPVQLKACDISHVVQLAKMDPKFHQELEDILDLFFDQSTKPGIKVRELLFNQVHERSPTPVKLSKPHDDHQINPFSHLFAGLNSLENMLLNDSQTEEDRERGSYDINCSNIRVIGKWLKKIDEDWIWRRNPKALKQINQLGIKLLKLQKIYGSRIRKIAQAEMQTDVKKPQQMYPERVIDLGNLLDIELSVAERILKTAQKNISHYKKSTLEILSYRNTDNAQNIDQYLRGAYERLSVRYQNALETTVKSYEASTNNNTRIIPGAQTKKLMDKTAAGFEDQKIPSFLATTTRVKPTTIPPKGLTAFLSK